MSKEKKVMETEKETQGESMAVQTPEEVMEAAFVEFDRACEAIKAKKRAVYDRFVELDTKMKGPGVERVTIPTENPFDLEGLRTAALETGSPAEAKEWIAMIQGLVMSVYRDDEFFAACMAVMQCARIADEQDQKLSQELERLELERDRIHTEMEKQIAKKRKELSNFRNVISDRVILKADDANRYLTENLPHCFSGEVSGRSIGLLTGPSASAMSQFNSLLHIIASHTKAVEKDPYKHFRDRRKGYTPDEESGVTVVAAEQVTNSNGRRSFFDILRGKR